MKMERQGDVLLVEISAARAAEILETATPVEFDGDVILAYGEVTGHAHRIKKGTVKMWSIGAERFIQALETTALTHEEHSIVPVEGWRQVIQQREYTPEAIRNVAD